MKYLTLKNHGNKIPTMIVRKTAPVVEIDSISIEDVVRDEAPDFGSTATAIQNWRESNDRYLRARYQRRFDQIQDQQQVQWYNY